MAANSRRDDDPTTDAGLIKRARDLGDESAWRKLVRRYDPALRRYGRRWAGDAEVEELMQLVWLKLVRELPGFEYDPSRSFRGWLRRLTEHARVDRMRYLGREPTIEQLGDHEPEAPREPTTAVGPRSRPGPDEAARAEKAVRGSVAPASWELFRRCAIEGERISEVAREMGKNYAAAYMAVQRVRRKLREEGDRRRDGAI